MKAFIVTSASPIEVRAFDTKAEFETAVRAGEVKIAEGAKVFYGSSVSVENKTVITPTRNPRKPRDPNAPKATTGTGKKRGRKSKAELAALAAAEGSTAPKPDPAAFNEAPAATPVAVAVADASDPFSE